VPDARVQTLIRDVLLRDGSTLRLQTTRPEDVGELKAFYDGLSWESLYLRFRGYPRTDLAARTEAEATGVDRLALIGRHSGQIVASASYTGLREQGVAEVSFAVADDFHGRGIATRMLEQIAVVAADRGIHRFDAEVMADNRPMLRVFEHAGFAVARVGFGGEMTVSLDLTPRESVRQRIGERDHVGAVAALGSLLAPSSIAVIGADGHEDGLATSVIDNVCAGGFRGETITVDPANVRGLPGTPELVIVAAAGDELLRRIADAAAIGARALLVLPAPGDNSEGHERLLDILRDSGLRMLGPGSLGVINTAADVSLNATFSSVQLRPGGLAIGSHAVALGLGLLGQAATRGLGVSTFVSLGARGDVSTSDLLEWCEEDPRTTAIMLYVETFGDPRRFTRVAKRVSRAKPVLVLKGNQGRPATHAHDRAQSQTAAALRDDQIFDAVLHDAGVLRCRSSEELCQVAELFESQPLPRGSQVGILTNSPAVAAIARDACTAHGLGVRPAAARTNPFVLGIDAGPEDYVTAIRRLLAEPGIDALMLCYAEHRRARAEGILEAISAACRERSKTAVACVVGSDGRLPIGSPNPVPNYLFPETCANVLARAAQRRAWLSRPLGERPSYADVDTAAARALIDSLLEQQPAGGWLDAEQLEALLTTHGIPVATTYRAGTLDQAITAAAAIGGPVAMKADLPAPARASEIHAVLLGLHGEEAIASGWVDLERSVHAAGWRWHGTIVQPLADPGADVLAGAFCDPELGTLLAVGLGGRQAGFGKAAAFRLPPTTDVEADELIDACEPVAAELDSFPGAAPLDRVALRELILRLALLVQSVPEVMEADLNTIRCTTHGCTVLDTRMRIARPRRTERVKTW
jgi:acyl-CoA synthetase (NDP forming)/RimJ/RimL family protein N-acetyltransferase